MENLRSLDRVIAVVVGLPEFEQQEFQYRCNQLEDYLVTVVMTEKGHNDRRFAGYGQAATLLQRGSLLISCNGRGGNKLGWRQSG